ncbi:MAG: dihydropteroate synthase [Armatimonadetes bacterium]|nr:dihydropteroate synthase [Armatimonadota bacterium]
MRKPDSSLRPSILRLGRFTLDLDRRVHVSGVLNVTADSFYAAARHLDPEAAVARAHQIVAQGADLLEVGGESARPGPDVPEAEEARRVVPLIRRLADAVRIPILVETVKPDVARAALDAGALGINDVSGLPTPEMARVAARGDAALVVMHRRGPHKIGVRNPTYDDVFAEVYAFLEERTKQAREVGVSADRLLIDPGFSFHKAPSHDVALLRRSNELLAIGYPIYLATSRKNYLRDILRLPPAELLEATAAAVVLGVERGARVVRTHDVQFTARLARTLEALLGLVDVPQTTESFVQQQGGRIPTDVLDRGEIR